MSLFLRSIRAQAARPMLAAFSTSSRAADISRIQLIGRLVADPEVKQTRNGKDYVRYTVATTDALGPPNENGERPTPTTSYHSIFAFRENAVQSLSNLTKGTQVFVDADFRIERVPASDDGPARDNLLVQHRSLSVLQRPKAAAPSE